VGAGWHRIRLEVPAERAELATDLLLVAGASGIVEDYPELHLPGPAISGDPREPVPPPPSPADGRIEVWGYLDADVDAASALGSLRASLADLPGLAGAAPRLEPVPDEDWGHAWREHYAAVDLGRRLRIRPTWEAAGEDGRLEIRIDPGLAFGTGTHFTTAACLELLEESLTPSPPPPPPSVLDVGTGTGVLAIGAVLLGAGEVVAFDADPDAVDVARGNLRSNGMADRIDLWHGTLADLPTGHRFDRVLANLLAPLLCELAEDLAATLQDGGLLIASGLLVEQEAEVCAAMESAGLNVVESRSGGEWAALTASRRPS